VASPATLNASRFVAASPGAGARRWIDARNRSRPADANISSIAVSNVTSTEILEAPSPKAKVAIITGASQGIGAGLTRAYRELGYAVIATARSIGPSEDPGIVTVAGDIADPETAQRVVGEAVERFGRIDTLINNAGIYIGKPFTDYTLEDFNALVAVNLAGFFHITTRTIKHMLDKGRGHVVNVSTTLVEQADSGRPAALSVLTKGGLVAATKSLAIEYASCGLRVNAVSLGVIKTAIHDVSSYAGMGALHPVGRVGEVEDVVGGVLYLESAPFVTGEVLHIDGGQSAGH
jgi:NAD(P)-dependent dehydrogenase (short-subunit alcohol dehydrogenase family)